MNLILTKIKDLLNNVKESGKRFPLSICYVALLSCIGIYQILSETEYIELSLAVLVGGLLAFLCELAFEYEIHRFKYLSLSSILGTILVFLLLKAYDNIYVHTAIGGIIIAIISLMAYVLYKKRSQKNLLSYLIKSGFIVEIFAGIVMAGVGVCISALHFLIYNFSDIWKIYGIAAILINGAFSIILFMSYIPKPVDEIETPTIYRTIIHKALFYIYLVLIGILYLYILKIIITWKMPVGKLNWFGCFALLFYVLFYLTVDEYDGKPQEIFHRYGAYLLIPILAIQLYAIGIRLAAYGLTTARFLSLILIVIAVSFMVVSIFKKSPKYNFIFIAVLTILVTCTKFNIYDIPNRNQEQRLKNALSAGGALTNEILDDSVELSPEYLETVKSAYEYLVYSNGTKSEFYEKFTKSKIAESFDTYYDEHTRYFSYMIPDITDFDISEYKTISYVDKDKLESFDINTVIRNLDLDKDEIEYIPVIKLNDNEDILITYLSFDYDLDEKEPISFYWEGYLLKK